MMARFRDCRLARMSDGHYCIVRDLGPVKGGKGLKHHEVVVDFSVRAMVRLARTALRRGWSMLVTRIRPTVVATSAPSEPVPADPGLVAEDAVQAFRVAGRR